MSNPKFHKFDFGYQYESTDVALPCEGYERKSPLSSLKVDKKEVECLETFSKGFLLGTLYSRKMTIEEVVFLPPNHIEACNKPGYPVSVIEYEKHYEIETWFVRKETFSIYNLFSEGKIKLTTFNKKEKQ